MTREVRAVDGRAATVLRCGRLSLLVADGRQPHSVHSRMRRLHVMDPRRFVGHPRRASMSWEGNVNTTILSARRVASRRRGFSAVLSMLFLMMFGVLAVGFSASTNTASQVAENDH